MKIIGHLQCIREGTEREQEPIVFHYCLYIFMQLEELRMFFYYLYMYKYRHIRYTPRITTQIGWLMKGQLIKKTLKIVNA